jgi:steroid 5-alpha reductase family enzyme
MTLLWLVSLALQNSSIVDIFWGAGFVVLNSLYFLLAPQGLPARKLLIAALVTIWGLRLSLYIFARNLGKARISATSPCARPPARAGGGRAISRCSCCKGF